MEIRKSKGEYLSPEVEVMELQIQGVIAASGDDVDVTVSDPWAGNEETRW